MLPCSYSWCIWFLLRDFITSIFWFYCVFRPASYILMCYFFPLNVLLFYDMLFCLVGWLVGCFSIYKCPHFTLALKRQFHRGPRFPAASDVPSASNTIIPQSSGCHHLDTSLALVMILSLFTLAALKVFVSDVLQFYYKMSRYEFPFLFNLLESCWASWIWGLISFINSRKLLSHFSLW